MAAFRLFWDYMSEQVDRIRRVVGVLDALGVKYALIGGHAVSYHWRPRVTVDVDFLVPAKSLARIQAALPAAGFIVEQRGELLRAWELGADPTKDEPVVDLVPTEFNETQREVVRTAIDVSYQGVALHMAGRAALVALKFLSAISMTRQQLDKMQDVTDLGHVVRQSWTPKHMAEARRLVERSYPAGGDELEKLIDDIQNGRPITICATASCSSRRRPRAGPSRHTP